MAAAKDASLTEHVLSLVKSTRLGARACQLFHTTTDARSRKQGKRAESTKRCWIVAQS